MTAREDARGPDRTSVGAFVLMVVLAGGNAVAIRYVSCATCELDPFWAAATRFLLAGVIFAMIARALHVDMPHGRALMGAMLYGALTFGAAFGFGYWGFVHASAGLGAVLLATTPLLTFLLALAQHQERFRWNGLAGGALALGGTALIFGAATAEGVPAVSLVALLASAACFAQGAIVVKGFPSSHPAAMNAIGMGAGAAILLVLSVVLGEAHVLPKAATTLAAQTYLVILGSLGVFALYLFLLRRWTASAVSYEGVLIPVVTVMLSTWLQDERITWAFVAGSIVVLMGVYTGALRRRSVR